MVNTNSLLILNFYYLTNSLSNMNNILKVYYCYLASILININDILKINFCYLTSTLTNTNDKANNFTKKEVGFIKLTIHFLSLNNAWKW